MIKLDPAFPEGEVNISGRSMDLAKTGIVVQNGQLLIRSDRPLNLADSLIIRINPNNLTDFILKAEQDAILQWKNNTEYDFLRIKTEANSQVEIINLLARQVDIQQEAESKVKLNSYTSYPADSIKIRRENAFQIDDKTFYIEELGVVVVDSYKELEEGGSLFYVLQGERIGIYTIIPNMMAKLEATSSLSTEEAPVGNLDIYLEGESEATVWVLERISGKGEGKSKLIIKGNPAIDYTTEGEAIIQQL